MLPDIVIVQDSGGYRILHGYLHLANELAISSQTCVEVQNDGKVMVIKTRDGYFVSKGGQLFPLLRR
jgi:hypothetical protein